ncbi:MAG TPA: glycosyltransferase family 39 protein [Patescibacteria group bacterium]|nr:glycosyltransferase family 39 protein [Patescibacteria group bacterium]
MKFFKKFNKHYLILGLILFATFLLRFPSLFEPFWYGDEGIFAAIGRNLNLGGTLYQTSWDNKPPMIYLTYAAIFKLFDVSMFWLRLTTLAFVLATATAIYEIARQVFGKNRALLATIIFGVLTSLRIIEGNLALTEIFMILPITLAMLFVIKRNFDYLSLFGAGILFAVASLYKQVGAFEAAALGIFLFFISKNLADFIKKGLVLSLGFVIPYGATIAYFAPKHLVDDYVFAAYTYYRIYLGESPKYALLINILKFLPIITAIAYGFYKKIKGEVGILHLILLWTAFSFLGSYFSGRTYGHYLVQATPALSLILASITLKPKLKTVQIGFAILFFLPLIFLTKLLFTDFLSGGPINQIKYFQNFADYSTGEKGVDEYNNYFDRNVNTIMALADFLKINQGYGESVYIWGDYPWLYAIADLKNPSRYVTSFHVFGVPEGQNEVIGNLVKNPPKYIIKPESSIGYFPDLEKFIAQGYTSGGFVETSEIFVKNH